jgi:hypothetical protein
MNEARTMAGRNGSFMHRAWTNERLLLSKQVLLVGLNGISIIDAHSGFIHIPYIMKKMLGLSFRYYHALI